MQRRKFLTATAATIPAIAFSNNFAIAEERNKKPFVVKAKESRFGEKTMVAGKNPNDIKVSGKDTANQLTIFEYTSFLKGGPPLHIHLKQEEVFFIIEGEYTFQVGEETHYLKAGDTIFLPRKVPHTFAQTSEFGRMFYLFNPSGKMEDFFRETNNTLGKRTKEQTEKLFTDHEMKIVGLPIKIEN